MDARNGPKQPSKPADGEPGKVGMAFLLWLLGVPGFLILAYLLFT